MIVSIAFKTAAALHAHLKSPILTIRLEHAYFVNKMSSSRGGNAKHVEMDALPNASLKRNALNVSKTFTSICSRGNVKKNALEFPW